MSQFFTYFTEGGNIYRRTDESIFVTDRDLAERIYRQHAESATQLGYFQRRAIELRDEMSAAITAYDAQFNLAKVA